MGKIKYRTCPICGRTLPLNRKFFKRNADQTFHTTCRYCDDEEKLEKRKLEWSGDLLLCHKCGRYLPVSEFGKSDHYHDRDGHDGRCRECRTKQAIETKKQYSKEYGLLKVLQMRYLTARERAKKKNLPFNITKEYLKELWDKQNGKCAISGIEMTFEQCNGRTATNVSIDQISPNGGYTMDNIQLVCMAINQFKSDFQMDEMYKFCECILENRKK